MAGDERKRKTGRRKKRKAGSPPTSASSGDICNQPVEGKGHGAVAVFPSEVSSVMPNYEWGWHKRLFVGTKRRVNIMAPFRDQLLDTCFLCAILYAAEQDIRRWLAIEEPDRQLEIRFDFDFYVTQYECEAGALLGQDVRFFHRTLYDRPRDALKVFEREGVWAYSNEWSGGKMIQISRFQFHKDLTFPDFENIIASGGSVIGGFPFGPEFKTLKPHEIYEFTPLDVVRQPAGSHMVQFIGTGMNVGREFLVFLNSRKHIGKDGVGKIYFDQIYSGVFTLECRAPPLSPPSDDPGLIVAVPDDNDHTLGSSGASPDGNNTPSFSTAPDVNKAPSSTVPTESLSQVGKYNRYDDDPICSCAITIDGWVPSAAALPVEDIQTRICASIVKIERPWIKKNLDEMGTVTRCFVPSNKMNYLHFTKVLLNIYDKLGGLNSMLALEHRRMIPFVNKIPTLILGRDQSHGSPGLSYIPSSAGVSKHQHGRKHKQSISSSGPANSSVTMNTTGPFPSFASSTSFTNTISMPLMHHNGSISSPSVVFGADATRTRESPTDQIVDIDRFLEDDWLGHKVDSFLSHDNSARPRDARSCCMACAKARASAKKVACFHFPSDGKLLATAGLDMKLDRLPVELVALQDCKEVLGMLFPSTSPNPNVPNWSTEGVISHAKVEDKKAMESLRKSTAASKAEKYKHLTPDKINCSDKEKRHRERRKGLLKSQADTAFNQKSITWHHIFMAICHKEGAKLYAERSLCDCELLMGDCEGALSDALSLRCRVLRPDSEKSLLPSGCSSCYSRSTNRPVMLSWTHKLDPGNAETESELRTATEFMKNPPVEGA